MFNIPGAIQVVLVSSLVALLGTILVRNVAHAQLKVSRQTLFVSMLPRRIEWLDRFRKAVSDWDRQMMAIIGHEGVDCPPEPTALFELGKLCQEATWLFGDDVANAAKAIDVGFEHVRNLRITARANVEGSREAALKIGQAVFDAYELFEPLNESIKSKLYVGDIENRKVVARWWQLWHR